MRAGEVGDRGGRGLEVVGGDILLGLSSHGTPAHTEIHGLDPIRRYTFNRGSLEYFLRAHVLHKLHSEQDQ